MVSEKKIIEVIQSVLGDKKERFSLHEPTIKEREKELINDCLASGFVSSVGTYVDRFEQMLAECLGVKHVIAVVNGTSALHISLLLAGVNESDEVIVPSLSFVATANAVSYCGAIPHFVEINGQTLGMDILKLEVYLDKILKSTSSGWINRQTGRRVSAIVPMHTFGHPVDMDLLNDLAQKFDLPVVEDAAESLGSRYKGRMAGSLSLISAISFNGNKIITTGGGGAIATDNTELAIRAKHLTTTAKVPHQWVFDHDAIGFNYRMPNLNAALGCAQLERLCGFVTNKRMLAEHYRAAFENINGVSFYKEPAYAKSNYWLNALLFDDIDTEKKERVLSLANNIGIMIRPVWKLLHKLSMYKHCPRMSDLSCAESLEQRIINIPSSPFLCEVETDNA